MLMQLVLVVEVVIVLFMFGIVHPPKSNTNFLDTKVVLTMFNFIQKNTLLHLQATTRQFIWVNWKNLESK